MNPIYTQNSDSGDYAQVLAAVPAIDCWLFGMHAHTQILDLVDMFETINP